MARVSLRVYNREIESLIDQGATNEAIAHCRHILKSFPKHLETYRLLGKSYLESHRYDEAVDIFSRVLMSVPDDFVSHVGMSIINDEQNKLDDSIWHMERAFESQPSNAAIQGELQRLYGRRDGMEPPKVRMTRGALAHMYVQGELYPQAIAEIRAVLNQDAQRADMQVLLARAYFKSGQKADSSEICAQLLKRYPYCFEANRIMVELVPSSVNAAENTQVYRTRVGELDPYAAVSKGSVFQTNDVQDAAVTLERLEYTGDEVSMGQNWSSSLGIGLGGSSAPALTASTSSDDQPDWLKGFSSAPSSDPFASVDPFSSASTPSTPPLQSQDEIPDFLRSAGWGESSGPEQPTSFFDTPDPAGGGDLAPADIPDWLKGQVPATPSPGATAPLPPISIESSPSQAIDTPDWLSGFGNSLPASAPVESSDTPDWLAGLNSTPIQPTPIESGGMPDRLSDLSASQDAESMPPEAGSTPDWLSGLGGVQAMEDVPPADSNNAAPDWLSEMANSQSAQSDESAQPADVPDWLSNLGNSQPADAAPANTPDWLSSEAPSTVQLGSFQEDEPAQPASVPDWLSGLSSPTESAPSAQPAQPSNNSIESLGSSVQEQDDAVAWLESLAAKHGAKPEELVTDPNKRSDTPPEWVEQARNASQLQQPVVPSTPAPTAMPTTASLENLGASTQEQDDAVAWLESLAAKHGAKPEELVTDPNKRSETPPEWVQQARSVAESQPAQSNEWSENAQNIGEQFFNDFEDAAPAAQANDETGTWLKGLEEKDQQRVESGLPDWMADSSDDKAASSEMPDWMKGEEEQPAGSQPAAQKGDVPDWLSGLSDDSGGDFAPNVQHLSGGDLSDWLSGLDDKPAEETSSTPAPAGDLPDWLSGLDAQNEKSADDWDSKSLETESAPASVPTEEPAPASMEADLPSWLQGMDEEKLAEPPQLTPTSPSDWHPADSKSEAPRKADLASRPPMPKPKPSAAPPISNEPVYEPIDKQDDWTEEPPAIQTRKPLATPPPIVKQPVVQPAMQSQPTVRAQPPAAASAPQAQPVMQKPAPAKKNGGRSETVPSPSALTQAKDELDRGDIPAALGHYAKLIKKGKHLEETIRDLTESIYRYPVEVGIWQTLGDAYMRGNRLKEALEAYNKAEELIR